MEAHQPAWRNWQTRWTQNPVRLKPRIGSTPIAGSAFLSNSFPGNGYWNLSPSGLFCAWYEEDATSKEAIHCLPKKSRAGLFERSLLGDDCRWSHPDCGRLRRPWIICSPKSGASEYHGGLGKI